jgi:general secretion pathway protein N
MMKRWWHYLLFGVVAWLVFMLWRFPAPVAYGIAAESLGGQVQLAGVTGTLWRGEAQQLQVQNRAIGGLTWQLSPWSLLLGQLDADITLMQDKAYLKARAETALGGGSLALSAIEGRLPLPLIQPYLSQVPFPLEGVVSLKLDGLQIDAEGRPQQADGRVVWHQAGVNALQHLLFGDLQMSLVSVEGGGIAGEISDSGGPLQLTATLTLDVKGAYHLKGQLKAADSAPQELRKSLPLLGKADARGFIPFNFSGVI